MHRKWALALARYYSSDMHYILETLCSRWMWERGSYWRITTLDGFPRTDHAETLQSHAFRNRTPEAYNPGIGCSSVHSIHFFIFSEVRWERRRCKVPLCHSPIRAKRRNESHNL